MKIYLKNILYILHYILVVAFIVALIIMIIAYAKIGVSLHQSVKEAKAIRGQVRVTSDLMILKNSTISCSMNDQ